MRDEEKEMHEQKCISTILAGLVTSEICWAQVMDIAKGDADEVDTMFVKSAVSMFKAIERERRDET